VSNTRRATRSRGRAASAAVLALLLGVAPGGPNLAAESSPLDRLRERSGEVRWQQQRHQWFAPDDPGPAEPSPPAADTRADRQATDPAEPETTRPEWPKAYSLFDPIELAPGTSTTTPVASETAPAAPGVAADSIDPAPPAPVTAAATVDHAPPTPATDDPTSLQALPDTVRQLLPRHAEVLPLPDFLDGAGPLWLAPRLRAAPRSDLRTDTAERPGSLLLVAQNQTGESMDGRPRGILRPITDISPFLDYDPEGGDACQYLCPTPSGICDADADYLCPAEEPLPESGSAERYFAHMNYFWAASNVYYNPLYFEDPVLERYGQVHLHDAVQPFYSVARFGGQLIGLPYQMALCPPHDRVYPLGYYRPGDPAPRLIYQPPLNAKAGAVSAGVYTGLFFLVP
jgi:hypothetical protein